MPEKIKCGVIGAGWWATFAHIPALIAHPLAELVAIQKRDPAGVRKVADDFGIPHACTTIDELLAIEGLDAVVVSSSPNMHYEQAALALRHGKHLLIEKPMTLTTAQASELQQLASEQHLQLLISCPWHYTPHAPIAQRLVRDGYLGKIRMISVLMTNPVSHLIRGTSTQPTHGTSTPYLAPEQGTYSDPAVAGAGQIYAQVCHAAAYIAFLTGMRTAEVFARFHNDGALLDIYDTLNLKMEDGSLVSIASTGATSLDRRDFELRVFGTNGMLFLDLWKGYMEFCGMSGGCDIYPALQDADIYPHEAPAKNLIDSIIDPARNHSPGRLGVAAMEVIEAACVSARSGKNIFVRDLVRQPK
ncbi:MAG: Gfo/Idh/MocA family oxidoreductase [Acidobacteriaceae bacterium]